MRRRDSWIETFRALGDSFLDVLDAELAVVREGVKAWGKSWAFAAACFAVVLFFLFWLLGLVTVAAVHGLMVWQELDLWQAALLVAALVLLVMAIAGGVGYALCRRHADPVTLTRERIGDHRGWWQEQIFLESGTAAVERSQISEGESDGAREQKDDRGSGAASEPPADG